MFSQTSRSCRVTLDINPKNNRICDIKMGRWISLRLLSHFFLAPSMPNEHLHSLQSSRVLPRENLGWGKPPNQNSVDGDVSHKTNGPSKTSMSRGSSTPPCVFCDAQSRGLRMRHMTPSPRPEATLLLTCQWSSNVIQRPLVRSDARRVFVGSDICKGGKVKG